MKKVYEKPEMEIVEFETEDITSSAGAGMQNWADLATYE